MYASKTPRRHSIRKDAIVLGHSAWRAREQHKNHVSMAVQYKGEALGLSRCGVTLLPLHRRRNVRNKQNCPSLCVARHRRCRNGSVITPVLRIVALIMLGASTITFMPFEVYSCITASREATTRVRLFIPTTSHDAFLDLFMFRCMSQNHKQLQLPAQLASAVNV